MKYWLSHLPLEVWVDCYRFPWISREELGQIVDRFGNRKYAEYLQFFLHDWGKRKLRELYFMEGLDFDFPLTQMPANIKSFEAISICHFDAQILNFLRQIGPILSDVNLDICGISVDELDQLRIILANLLPLLDIIHSLAFNVYAIPTVQQCFGNEGLTTIKMLETVYFGKEAMDDATLRTTVNFLVVWLTSREQAGIGPKLCYSVIHNDTAFGPQIAQEIREQFLVAQTPCTFAVYIDLYFCKWNFAEFHLQNGIGEELHGLLIGNECYQITRHRANCGTELQEWIDESNAKFLKSRIEICQPTIGLIDAAMDARENLEEANQQQASKSKAV